MTIFPNDNIVCPYSSVPVDKDVFIHPSCENSWITPDLSCTLSGEVRLVNTTSLPINLKKNQVLGHAFDSFTPTSPEFPSPLPSVKEQSEIKSEMSSIKFNPQNIDIDPIWSTEFEKLHEKYQSVFNSDLPGYNGKFGSLFAHVNVGDSLPPQRKGRVPQYSRNMLSELQEQFDSLESIGVFAKPEDVGVYAEYVNPSLLVNKPDGGHRLVTSFGEVAMHNKPTPTLTPSVDSTLRNMGGWKYIIKTDLRKAYFQIPLHQDSRKYCGVVTPFKGVRVYCRAAMGMPGSESALDELMSRILGDLIQQGRVERVADDIYIGGSDLLSVFKTWEIVLRRFQQANLRLSGPKTIIFPASTCILGWVWSQGKLSASPHHLSSLAACELPKTVKALRSYIGAYKVVSRVLKNCSQYLSHLEGLTAGKQSSEQIVWSQSSLKAFHDSQHHLQKCTAITIPAPEDKLWLVTDACSSNPGIAATLLASLPESNSPQLASFFSAKLREGHTKWLPCELECLAVATAINHFRPLILNSEHTTSVLTDSKPVVQAFNKFLQGHYSTSARMQSFLLAATQNNVKISHIKGINNIVSDFGSRNSVNCNNSNCSVCKFINESESLSVNSVSISDIVSGQIRVPFASPKAWLQIQLNCSTVQLARKHLQQGTQPLKKQRNLRDVKQLIRLCSVTRDGLLVVNKNFTTFQPTQEQIVIPSNYAPGLLAALHLQLGHPTPHQLKQVFSRQFFCINSDKLIEDTSDNCHPCLALKKLPKSAIPECTSAPYKHVGSNFSADVMKRCNQDILVTCEEVTKFTQAILIPSEKQSDICVGLKNLLLPLHPPCSPVATLKIDPGPGMRSLYLQQPLKCMNIVIDLGEPKNKNKLATIDKQIQELENELIRIAKPNSPVTSSTLSLSVANLNSRIRSNGLSSYEQWIGRDQYSKSQLNVKDRDLIDRQATLREISNKKTHKSSTDNTSTFNIGTIVYIINEKTKHGPRPRYIVDRIDGAFLILRKLGESILRTSLYKVHRDACIRLKPSKHTTHQPANNQSSDSDTDIEDSDTHNSHPQELVSDTEAPNQSGPAALLPITTNTRPNQPDSAIPLPGTTSTRPPRERRIPGWLKDYEHEVAQD